MIAAIENDVRKIVARFGKDDMTVVAQALMTQFKQFGFYIFFSGYPAKPAKGSTTYNYHSITLIS